MVVVNDKTLVRYEFLELLLRPFGCFQQGSTFGNCQNQTAKQLLLQFFEVFLKAFLHFHYLSLPFTTFHFQPPKISETMELLHHQGVAHHHFLKSGVGTLRWRI